MKACLTYRPLPRLARLASLAPLAMAWACSAALTGCGNASSGSDAPDAVSGGLDILDEYEAVGDIPEVDGITKIVFIDETNYALKKTTGSDDGEQIVKEYGTYVADPAAGTLTLTDSKTGETRSLPFKATPIGASASSESDSLHPEGTSLVGPGSSLAGAGSILLSLVCTFTLNTQSFMASNISCSLNPSSGSSGSGAGGAGSTSPGSSSPGSTSPGSSSPGSSSPGSSSPGSSSPGSSSPGSSSPGSSSPGSSSSADGGSSLTQSAADGGTPLVMAGGQGVDVSHWDGKINWTQVKAAGQTFAYAKATESTGYNDDTFKANYAGMQSAGMMRGAYHFFNASSDPTAQATHFVTVLKAAGFTASDLPPALDVEAVPGLGPSSAAKVTTILNAIKSQLGVTPIIYTDAGDWARMGNPNMASYALWIASVGKGGSMSSLKAPKLPPGWSAYSLWQKSWVGKISGISAAKVDLDFSPLSSMQGA
jgi:lysozyme